MCLPDSFDVMYGCQDNLALADVRSTGAGIECLYYIVLIFPLSVTLYINCNFN